MSLIINLLECMETLSNSLIVSSPLPVYHDSIYYCQQIIQTVRIRNPWGRLLLNVGVSLGKTWATRLQDSEAPSWNITRQGADIRSSGCVPMATAYLLSSIGENLSSSRRPVSSIMAGLPRAVMLIFSRRSVSAQPSVTDAALVYRLRCALDNYVKVIAPVK